MTVFLDNYTLRDALLAQGFQDITSENRSTKSWRLQHPLMRHWVSIKLSDDASRPVTASPLVVHPDDARKLSASHASAPGITLVGPYRGGSTKYGDVLGQAVALEGLGAVDGLVRTLTGVSAEEAARHLGRVAIVPDDAALQRVAARTSTDFEQALLAIADRMTAEQRAMLLGHASAPDQRLSMQAIAMLGGYESYAAANSQYGTLGHWMAEQFGITSLHNWTQALATGNGDVDADGHFIWTLRSELLAALRSLGWLQSDDVLAATQAARELDAEGQARSPTTRQALIYARVGQGLYRERVLKLWHWRCAVTGCSVLGALIASHAEPWKGCTDEVRLDEYNGLPLTASIDKLFDRGLIAFDDDGGLLRSPALAESDLAHLGLQPDSRLRADCLGPRHLPYLRAHRARHGF